MFLGSLSKEMDRKTNHANRPRNNPTPSRASTSSDPLDERASRTSSYISDSSSSVTPWSPGPESMTAKFYKDYQGHARGGSAAGSFDQLIAGSAGLDLSQHRSSVQSTNSSSSQSLSLSHEPSRASTGSLYGAGSSGITHYIPEERELVDFGGASSSSPWQTQMPSPLVDMTQQWQATGSSAGALPQWSPTGGPPLRPSASSSSASSSRTPSSAQFGGQLAGQLATQSTPESTTAEATRRRPHFFSHREPRPGGHGRH
jgi:hypothetical protein